MTDPLPTEVIDLPPASSAPVHPRKTFGLVLVFFFCLWAVLCRFLGAEWTINDQYNYGWFVPFFAVYLFWTRWESRPEPETVGRRRRTFLFLIGGVALLSLLPLRLFEVANPDWRLLGWLHAFVAAGITLLALYYVGGVPWLRYFAFPLAFFFVAVPWLLIVEVPLVQVLMRFVAMGASEVATLCGIPAEFEGNLIRVNAGVVGVNEACSGVRSLQTSLMIGLLFGDLWRLTAARRFWLVAGALAIAIGANFARAFFLVWVAAGQGLSAIDRWHDVAGYFILGAVCLGSILLAALLARRQRRASAGEAVAVQEAEAAARETGPYAAFPKALVVMALLWLVSVEVAVEGWYRVHERRLAAQIPWTVSWPSTGGAKTLPLDEKVKRILRFNDGGGAEWPLPMSGQAPGRALLYFFRWTPGSTSITRARAHRPDICLPSSGWQFSADHGLRYYNAAENFSLPFRHYNFVREEEGRPIAFANAFFCVYEDLVRRNPQSAAPPDATSIEATRWMIAERCRVVWTGLRNPGQQVLEIIFISRQEVAPTAAETKFAEILPSLVRVGDAAKPSSTSR